MCQEIKGTCTPGNASKGAGRYCCYLHMAQVFWTSVSWRKTCCLRSRIDFLSLSVYLSLIGLSSLQ